MHIFLFKRYNSTGQIPFYWNCKALLQKRMISWIALQILPFHHFWFLISHQVALSLQLWGHHPRQGNDLHLLLFCQLIRFFLLLIWLVLHFFPLQRLHFQWITKCHSVSISIFRVSQTLLQNSNIKAYLKGNFWVNFQLTGFQLLPDEEDFFCSQNGLLLWVKGATDPAAVAVGVQAGTNSDSEGLPLLSNNTKAGREGKQPINTEKKLLAPQSNAPGVIKDLTQMPWKQPNPSDSRQQSTKRFYGLITFLDLSIQPQNIPFLTWER